MYKSYRIKRDDESDEDDGDFDDNGDNNRAPSENVYDPMLVLGWLDSEKFEGASAFFFTKLALVKEHLRTDHKVDTRGLEGNDLYKRYRVRAADGLVQRFLNSQDVVLAVSKATCADTGMKEITKRSCTF